MHKHYKKLVITLLSLLQLSQLAALDEHQSETIDWVLPNGQKLDIIWTDTLNTNALAMYGFISDDLHSTVTYTTHNSAVEISIESVEYGSYAYNRQRKEFEAMSYHTGANDALINDTAESDISLKSTTTANTDTLPIFDLLFVFTKETKTALGGLDQVIAKAKQCVNNSNNVFRSSKINTSLRLVQVAEIDYRSSSILANELGYMRSKTDGRMDEIHAMRDKAGADVVCLLTDKDVRSTRGMAYILTSENGSPSNAFTVCYYSTAHGVFPHEIGHTLGCNHNIEYGGSKLYYNSFGHHFSHKGETRGTMMSYIGKRCSRFAGTNTYWEGSVTGVDSIANTVNTINKSGYIVAKYRQSKDIIDPRVNMESLSKDTLKCTVSNKASKTSTSLQLTLDMPSNATIKEIIADEKVSLSGGSIRIDSLKGYGNEEFEIILDMSGVTQDTYQIISTVKNTADQQVDFNPADNTHTLDLTTAASRAVTATRGIRLINSVFTHNIRLEVKQATSISIYDMNGRMQLNTTIQHSQSLGEDLPKGIYFLKASSNKESQTFKIIKH